MPHKAITNLKAQQGELDLYKDDVPAEVKQTFFTRDRFATCWHTVKFDTGREEGEFRKKCHEIGTHYRIIEGFDNSPFKESFYLYDNGGDDKLIVMMTYEEDDTMPKSYMTCDSLAFAKDFIGLLAFYGEIKCEDWRKIDNYLENLKSV